MVSGGDSRLINQTIDTFIKERLDNNAALLTTVLTDDVWHNPDWYTREGYVKEVTEEWLRWDRFTIENRDITIGEEMAVVESKWSYRFTGDDEYFALGLPVNIRLYKQNGKWLINGIYQGLLPQATFNTDFWVFRKMREMKLIIIESTVGKGTRV